MSWFTRTTPFKRFAKGISAAVVAIIVTGCAQTGGTYVAADSMSGTENTSLNWPSPKPGTTPAPAQAPAIAAPVATPKPAPPAAPEAAAPEQNVVPESASRTVTAAPRRATSAPRAAVATAPASKGAAIKQGPNDVWERIRNGFQMRGTGDASLVGDWENYYASKPDYFAQMIGNSSRFLFHVANEVERRGMPLEIALLPMIESAYNPVAYSHAHASGIWQFIPSTGKHYGLKQNWWYDGRRDFIAATGAALDYLQMLHGMFNDWELALAAYNWGEGAVQRAIDRNQARGLGTDYLSLAAGMPAETRNYLPKLLAIKNIVALPERYGLTLAHVPNEPYFETVRVKRHIDVALAARFAGLSVEEFKFLNPAHSKPVINANSAETLVLPKDKAAAFLSNLSQHDNKPLVSMKTHTVRAGELPQAIAAQYGISVDELNSMNNIGPRRRIATGQTLMVPNSELQPMLDDLPVAINSAEAAIRPIVYTRTVMQRMVVVRGGVRQTVMVPARVTVPNPGRMTVPVALQRVTTAPLRRVGAAKPAAQQGRKGAPLQKIAYTPNAPAKKAKR